MGTRRTLVAMAAGLGGALALAGCNLGTRPVSYPSGLTSPSQLADLDGDGDLDVLTTGAGHGVFTNDGAGHFGTQLFPSDRSIEKVTLGDVDEDGDLDKLDMSSGVAYLALNDGDGTFGTEQQLDLATSVNTLDVGDLDGDGHLDLVVATYPGAVQVRLGDGTGAFGDPVAFPLGTAESYGPEELQLVDLDDDGALDAVTSGLGFDAGGNQGFVGVLLGDGLGGFEPYHLYPTADRSTNGPGMSIADLDEDGNLDVVTGNTFVRVLSYLEGDGTGAFAAQVEVPTLGEPTSTAVGDIDDDGHPDVIVGQGRGGLEVMFGDGSGAFPDSLEVASGGRLAGSVHSADVDGDGRPDLVVGHNGADGEVTSVGVLINHLGPRS
jgi:hypothetical protein